MKESQEEFRQNWLLQPQREAEIFFALENKRFQMLFLIYLIKKDWIEGLW